MRKTTAANVLTTIYFTNHQKRQLVDFLKKYPCTIYITNYLKRKFLKFTFEYNQKCQCLDTEIQ